ncbi:TetR/AcrR family transcriptional regulator [Polaribacter litorisediminis]|uniref:TetR/AcrR family transcriptional regulator n=1 Tax=Polaribacter litorisediminis TaxID=1908341 RepID=UPI001CC04696|nr:TetR/AcrR family transcriptional regulator [Polaribacter litorisediminis]UAM99038.1 TetR/AcrR family transcriptional regulator [Polaribacter litorisediminis]
MAKLQKSIDKRNALIKATIELVNNNGFHGTPMSKIAKMANVSPATIYLYFQNKQDLVNQTYLEVKTKYTDFVFKTYHENTSVKTGFELIWRRIAEFNMNQSEYSFFLNQCNNTPIIDEPSRKEGIGHLQPLLDLWERGRNEAVIKPISDYILYAYSINPLSFLMIAQKQGEFQLTKTHIQQSFLTAWDSIKL